MDSITERHHMFCKAFGLRAGDRIRIKGWFTYEIGINGLYSIVAKEVSSKEDDEVYSMIVKRGFEKVN